MITSKLRNTGTVILMSNLRLSLLGGGGKYRVSRKIGRPSEGAGRIGSQHLANYCPKSSCALTPEQLTLQKVRRQKGKPGMRLVSLGLRVCLWFSKRGNIALLTHRVHFFHVMDRSENRRGGKPRLSKRVTNELPHDPIMPDPR